MNNNDGFIETILIDIWNITDSIANIAQRNSSISILTTGILLILGIVIIINQLRIHKQLRKIQEQLKQKGSEEK